MDLVSIIIITYKRPLDILMRAVQSVRKQTYQDLEIIIVNDCPEEAELAGAIRESLEALGDKRIKLIVHEKNKGACQARNTGITNASGKYIALLDDDDEWVETKIEKQLAGFTDEKVGMVYSPFYNIEKEFQGKVTVRGTKSGNLVNDLLYRNCLGGCSMSMMRKEAVINAGMFDADFPASQDYDMWIRIAERYNINYIPEPLTYRYLLDESITKNFAKKQKGFEMFMKKHEALYESNRDALNYRYTHRARECFKQGEYKTGFSMLKKGIRAKYLSVNNLREPFLGMAKRARDKVLQK